MTARRATTAQEQVPPLGIARATASEAHLRSQVLPLAQPTLHDPVQTT